jgi:hypothetical protein
MNMASRTKMLVTRHKFVRIILILLKRYVFEIGAQAKDAKIVKFFRPSPPFLGMWMKIAPLPAAPDACSGFLCPAQDLSSVTRCACSPVGFPCSNHKRPAQGRESFLKKKHNFS